MSARSTLPHEPRVLENVPVNVNITQQLSICNTIDLAMKGDSMMYKEKVSAAVLAWEALASCLLANNPPDPEITQLLDSMVSNTLMLKSHAQWGSVPEALRKRMGQLMHSVSNLISQSATLPQVDNASDQPCQQPIVQEVEVTLDEVETGMLLVLRLEQLMASHCNEAAQKLASLAVQEFKNPQSRLSKATDAIYQYKVFGVCIELLYKNHEGQMIVDEVLQDVPLDEAMQIVRQVSTADSAQHEVALFCTSSLMSSALRSDVGDEQLADLALQWASLHQAAGTGLEALASEVLALLRHAGTHQVYALCTVLLGNNELCLKLRPTFVDLLIRSLTLDMNQLEEEHTQVSGVEISLAYGFAQLAQLYSDNVLMHRECLLSSFSLNPTENMYTQLVQIAQNFSVNKSESNPISLHKNNPEVISQQSDNFQIPIEVFDNLGLSAEACDDVSILVSSARWRRLSWSLPWPQLSTLCQRYIRDPEATRFVVHELEHLHPVFEPPSATTKKKLVKKSPKLVASKAKKPKKNTQRSSQLNGKESLESLVASVCNKLVSTSQLEARNVAKLNVAPTNLAVPMAPVGFTSELEARNVAKLNVAPTNLAIPVAPVGFTSELEARNVAKLNVAPTNLAVPMAPVESSPLTESPSDDNIQELGEKIDQFLCCEVELSTTNLKLASGAARDQTRALNDIDEIVGALISLCDLFL